ncbi:glycosyltransferase family 39 protein [Actomonas aquatica]|uniref:Glycosyltransferase family 39 protein n=1 Tax=Actomonas aquatica TaxID=2866162 RepID=A0ABZ1CCM6_9BACT|nr:glycosyltransferase family 39 protein [Opitutus sp. WL0086]WRQ89018.1 glycosyltransferase family 39 protein [Opitutus sp. WL0086]
MALLCLLVLLLGAGLPLAPRLADTPWRRAALTPFAGLLVLFLIGALLHGLRLPATWWPLVGLLATGGLWAGRREVKSWIQDPATRTLLAHWALWALWLLGCLALIRHYSGGDWTNDWIGHYHRAQHILHQSPTDAAFFAADPFPSRPPLLNTITALVLGTVGDTFAHYQVVMTLLGSLAFFPARLLVRELCTGTTEDRAARWLLVLLMASPALMQNATFPWTKLGTAAWVLLAAVLTWRGLRHQHARDLQLAGAAAAGAVVSHYSAAIYLVVALATLAWIARRPEPRRLLLRALPWSAALFAVVMGTWLLWSVGRYGWTTTFASNSTVSFAAEGDALRAFAINLLRTVVPAPFLPPFDPSYVPPANVMADWRDHRFHFYQETLPGMLGLTGLVVLVLSRAVWWPRLGAVVRQLGLPILAVVLLGIAAHTAPAAWGVAHICLLTLPLAFVAGAAVLLAKLPSPRRVVLAAALFFDLAAGIGLQLFIENARITPGILAYGNGEPLLHAYGQTLWLNAAMQIRAGYTLLGEQLPGFAWAPLTLGLVALFITTFRRALRA